MDMLDPGLDGGSAPAAPSHEKSQEAEEGGDLGEGEAAPGEEGGAGGAPPPFGDPGLQLHFRSDGAAPAQVTYRVVQVTEAPLEGQAEATGAVSVVSTFSGTQQSPFSNGGSPGAEPGAEPRFAYFPAGGVAEGAVSVQAEPALAPAGGQFYVMMAPQDVLQSGSPRTIAPRTHPYSPKPEGPRTPRDERRRAQHNEVERRRRDKINNWIVQLSKIIPECGADSSKTGASKGGILCKACDYIRELRQSNQRLREAAQEAERLQLDNDLLRRQVEELRGEQALLRGQLAQQGREAPDGPAP